MPTIKQKTVNGRTLELKRSPTHKDGAQYEYYVSERGSGPVDDPVYTREAGERQLRETVQAYERADKAESSGPSLPGMGGGGGEPQLPDLGLGPRDDGDGDDEPRFPWM